MIRCAFLKKPKWRITSGFRALLPVLEHLSSQYILEIIFTYNIMTRYTRRTRHRGGAGAAPEGVGAAPEGVGAAPGAGPAFAVVDDRNCGHILDHIQNQRIMTVELMQDAVSALVTRFTQKGLMAGNCTDLLSHLVCPLVWRVLQPDEAIIPDHWLKYGAPPGNGLSRYAPEPGCHIDRDPDQLDVMYDDVEEWDRIVGILRATPGFVPWLLNIVHDGPVQAQHFAGNMALLGLGEGNEWENAGAAEENQMAPIHAPLSPRTVGQLEAYTPGTRAAIMASTPTTRAAILGHGGKRSTRRKQRKNRRSTRR
jgi:hypothetical protein